MSDASSDALWMKPLEHMYLLCRIHEQAECQPHTCAFVSQSTGMTVQGGELGTLKVDPLESEPFVMPVVSLSRISPI